MAIELNFIKSKPGADSLREGRSRDGKNGTENNPINGQNNNGTNGNNPNNRWDNQPKNKGNDNEPVRLDTLHRIDSSGIQHNDNFHDEKFTYYYHYEFIKKTRNVSYFDNLIELKIKITFCFIV